MNKSETQSAVLLQHRLKALQVDGHRREQQCEVMLVDAHHCRHVAADDQRLPGRYHCRVRRHGRKKAIVAIARRLLCMMTAMLNNGQPYRYAAPR